MTFKARTTFNKELIRTIYAVQQLENGMTEFLIYDESFEKWMWVSASAYEPVKEV